MNMLIDPLEAREMNENMSFNHGTGTITIGDATVMVYVGANGVNISVNTVNADRRLMSEELGTVPVTVYVNGNLAFDNNG